MAYAYPIIKAFEKWRVAQYPQVLPKSPIGKALAYTITYMRGLARYVTDGKYKMDNNLIEKQCETRCLRKKNYLFCGNHEAAEDTAVLYSMTGCCKAADVDFKVWMNYFLSHVHNYDTDYTKDLADLLPASLKKNGII